MDPGIVKEKATLGRIQDLVRGGSNKHPPTLSILLFDKTFFHKKKYSKSFCFSL